LISQFCKWLDATPLSQTFQGWVWFVPTVQTVHILCIAVVVTSVGMLDFKLLGIAGRERALAAMVSSFMPWIWSALAILLATGVLLTITEPARELMNVAFRTKMLMVLIVVMILRRLEFALRHNPGYGATPRLGARLVGAGSLLLVVAIVVAGRWIAYL